MFATALPPATAAPSAAPVRAPAAHHAAADGPSSFAGLLSHAEQTPAHDSDAPVAPTAMAAANKLANARGARPCTPTAGTTKLPATATPPTADRPQDGPAAETLNNENGAADAGTADASALLASLAAWATPALAPAAATAGSADAFARSRARGVGGGDGEGGGAAALLAGKTTGGGTKTDTAASTEAGAEISTSSSTGSSSRAQGFAGLVALAQAAAQHSADEREYQGGRPDAPAPLAEASGAGAVPLPSGLLAATGSAGWAPTAIAEARLSAPPGSAAFASQLGAQLSTFVREGVQHARLELHPVELGPVTVQIQLEGGAAQVDLSAQNADTRQALEHAMPQLASSLREAGLTLSGGGVFEQPRQPQPDGGNGGRQESRSPRSANAVGSSNTQAQLVPAGAPRRRGVVDLVA